MSHPTGLLELSACGLLSEDEDRGLRLHLRECAHCREELALLSALAEGLQAVPATVVPEGLAARTKARLAVERGSAEERRMSDAILVFLVLFAWTVTGLPWAVGQSLGMSSGLAFWLFLWTAAGWITGGVAVAVLLFRRRRPWSVS
ncbi:MAG TPA: hypothetical protein DEH78_32475 [Solibacterales bacterium]|nr:hypothetical protein [Bryobacterales bacterium]